jgi:hypothetical protein
VLVLLHVVSKVLDKYLHSTAKMENKVECGFFLNVMIGKSATVLKLLAGKDKTLLVGRDLGFHVVDGVE